MESLIADLVRCSFAIAKYLFLERRLSTYLVELFYAIAKNFWAETGH